MSSTEKRNAGPRRLHRRGFLTTAAAAAGSAMVSGTAFAGEAPPAKKLITAEGNKVLIANPLKDIIPRAHGACVNGFVFSADGKLLASRGADKTVKVWSLSDGRPVAMLEGHKEQVQCTAISPDSKLLASGDVSGVILLWEMGTSKRYWVLFDPELPAE